MYTILIALFVLLAVQVFHIFFTCRIYCLLKKSSNEAGDSTRDKVLELLRDRPTRNRLRVPAVGVVQKPTDLTRGSVHWRCWEDHAGTHVSRMGEDDKETENFTIPSHDLEEVVWALCQLS